MVVADVLGHEAFEMPLVENNDMIEQVSSAVADEAFRDAVLPRTTEAGLLRLDAETLHRVDDLAAEIGCPVEDEVFGCRIIWKCLAKLLADPHTRRMPGHVAEQNTPPVMGDDEEAVDTPKVSVGTVKKSIAVIASRWLLRNAAHRFAGFGDRGAFRIQRNTVRSEMSKPSIFSSP